MEAPASLSPSSVSTGSFSSTIPGIGMIAGRAIKRVGQTIIHFAEETIVLNRLETIEKRFEDKALRSAMFCDSQSLYRVMVDLVELLKPGNSVTGHSLTGYPARINRRAAEMYQKIHRYILDVGPGCFRQDKINEVLSCCCRAYWFFKTSSIQMELIDQVVQICGLQDAMQTLRPRRRIKWDVLTQCREVLRDFSTSSPEMLQTWDLRIYSAVHRVFKAASFKFPYAPAEYRVLFEDGFLMAMARLSERNLPHYKDVQGYHDSMRDIFKPLIATNVEFEVHLVSLSCAYIYSLSGIAHARYFAFLASLRYPFECYQATFPGVEIIARLNVDFIHKIVMGLISSTAEYRQACPTPGADSSRVMLRKEYHFVSMAIKCLTYLTKEKVTQALLLDKDSMYQDIPRVVKTITGPRGLKFLDPEFHYVEALSRVNLM